MPPRARHMLKSEQEILPDRRKLRVLRRLRPQPLSLVERDVDPQRTLAKVDYVFPTEVSHCAKILGRYYEATRASRGFPRPRLRDSLTRNRKSAPTARSCPVESRPQAAHGTHLYSTRSLVAPAAVGAIAVTASALVVEVAPGHARSVTNREGAVSTPTVAFHCSRTSPAVSMDRSPAEQRRYRRKMWSSAPPRCARRATADVPATSESGFTAGSAGRRVRGLRPGRSRSGSSRRGFQVNVDQGTGVG
jgi:hypothetical protein